MQANYPSFTSLQMVIKKNSVPFRPQRHRISKTTTRLGTGKRGAGAGTETVGDPQKTEAGRERQRQTEKGGGSMRMAQKKAASEEAAHIAMSQ